VGQFCRCRAAHLHDGNGIALNTCRRLLFKAEDGGNRRERMNAMAGKGLLALLCLLTIQGCANSLSAEPPQTEETPLPVPKTLEEIAFNVNRDYGYTVYIPEDGEYVPYLVITNLYNWNCLLLRKYLLDDQMSYGSEPEYWIHIGKYGFADPVYYENSGLDRFLRTEFLERLSAIDEYIIDSEIVITHIDGIGMRDEDTTVINRKVFSLSLTELHEDIPRWATRKVEGRPLSFFADKENRRARHSSGGFNKWFLRTPIRDPGGIEFIFTVQETGDIWPGGTTAAAIGLFYVRPAFCLPQDTPIREAEIDGQAVFKLALDGV
jgi:hypothetical protein